MVRAFKLNREFTELSLDEKIELLGSEVETVLDEIESFSSLPDHQR